MLWFHQHWMLSSFNITLCFYIRYMYLIVNQIQNTAFWNHSYFHDKNQVLKLYKFLLMIAQCYRRSYRLIILTNMFSHKGTIVCKYLYISLLHFQLLSIFCSEPRNSDHSYPHWCFLLLARQHLISLVCHHLSGRKTPTFPSAPLSSVIEGRAK